MSIDFKAALLYPFREENRRDMVWIPGIALYAVFFIFLVLFVIAGFSFYGGDFLDQLSKVDKHEADGGFILFYNGFQLLQSIPNLLFSILAYGYLWQLCGRWQIQGYDAPPIHWSYDLRGLLFDGLKLMLYYIIVSFLTFLPIFGLFLFVVVVLAMNATLFSQHPGLSVAIIFFVIILAILIFVAYMMFTGPFLLAPIIASAQTRRLADLFNLARGWQLALKNFRFSLWAMLAIVGLSLTYMLAMLLMLIPCCVGLLIFPFFSFTIYVSMAHLANQGLWREPPTAIPADTSPPPPQIIS